MKVVPGTHHAGTSSHARSKPPAMALPGRLRTAAVPAVILLLTLGVVLASLVSLPGKASANDPIQVTLTTDAGAPGGQVGDLRWAIIQANATRGPMT